MESSKISIEVGVHLVLCHRQKPGSGSSWPPPRQSATSDSPPPACRSPAQRTPAGYRLDRRGNVEKKKAPFNPIVPSQLWQTTHAQPSSPHWGPPNMRCCTHPAQSSGEENRNEIQGHRVFLVGAVAPNYFFAMFGASWKLPPQANLIGVILGVSDFEQKLSSFVNSTHLPPRLPVT